MITLAGFNEMLLNLRLMMFLLQVDNEFVYTVKKILGDSWIIFDYTFQGLVLGKLFPARESLVNDIPAGDRKSLNLYLQCTLYIYMYFESQCCGSVYSIHGSGSSTLTKNGSYWIRIQIQIQGFCDLKKSDFF